MIRALRFIAGGRFSYFDILTAVLFGSLVNTGQPGGALLVLFACFCISLWLQAVVAGAPE